MLSLRDEFKIIQIINVNIVMFLMFSLICKCVFEADFKKNIFIIICIYSIIVYFTCVGLKSKIKYTKWIMSIFYLVIVIMFFYKFEAVLSGIYTIYLFLILYCTIKNKDSGISYEEMLKSIKEMAIFTVVMLMIYFFIGEGYFNSVIKYYFILIPLNLILLRMSRAIDGKIEDKKMRQINIIIMIVTLIAVTETSQIIFKRVFKILTTVLSVLIEKIFFILAVIVYYPAKFMGELIIYIKGLISKEDLTRLKNQEILQIDKLEDGLEKTLQSKDFIYGEVTLVVIKIILIAAMLFVILLVTRRLISSKEEEVYEEIVESIESKPPKLKLKDKLRDFMKRDNSIRGRILFAYKKFTMKCKERGIIKGKYTATELSDLLNKIINEKEELDNIKDIYNEAKFSNHYMEKNKAEDMESYVANINKKISVIQRKIQNKNNIK